MATKNGVATPRKVVTEAIAAETKAPEILRIPRPDLKTFSLQIKGISPLMMHAWSEKVMSGLPGGSGHKDPKTGKRPARDPEKDFREAAYRHPEGGYGFPAVAFKQAAVSAIRLIDGLTMAEAKLMFLMPQDFVKIESPEPTMDSRPVRLQRGGSVEMRYRPVFWPWSTNLEVRYNARAVTVEQIVNLLVLAGECVGIGEWRPEKGGKHGRFTIGS